MPNKATTSNTHHWQLVKHTVAAVGSALVAALSAAPFITVVDKAITSNASGREPLWTCMGHGLKSIFTTPKYFFGSPSFRWIAFVYSGTYVVANLTQLGCEYKSIDWQKPKFAATSVTNISLSALKDMAFAKMFAKVGAPARSVPLMSLLLFGSRDSMTILASFSLPPLLAPLLSSDARTGRSIAQMGTPIVMQAAAVPLHLIALDLFNNPTATFAERLHFLRREYGKTVIARWCRIAPAYSLGGIVNLETWDVFRRIAGDQPWRVPDAETSHADEAHH